MTLTVSGISLYNAPNWGVSSAIFDIPQRRGGNFYIAHAGKRLYLPKPVDERSARIEMWVSGASVSEYQTNLRNLLNMFHFGQTEIPIVRDGLTGYGQVVSDASIKPVSRNSCKLSIELLMSDPYFYESAATEYNLAGLGELEIFNEGVEVDCNIEIAGDVTNPELTGNGRELLYTGTASSANKLTVDTSTFIARRGTDNAIPDISHNGDYKFWSILPGLQTVTFDGTAGVVTPTLKITFTKGYI